MKQKSNGVSSQKREGYYDYILRRYREEEAELSVDERENLIADLKFRIHRLEEDMAHVLRAKRG